MRHITEDHIRKNYKGLAHDYESRWKNFLTPVRRWVLNRFNYPKDRALKVLDLGCGTGAFLLSVVQKYPNASLAGFDVSTDMLDLAKRTLSDASHLMLETKNLEAMTAQTPPCDVVISLFAFHHITDQTRFLQTIIESTKSGGDIFIADYAVNGAFMTLAEIYWRLFLSSHYKAHSARRLKKMIDECGGIEIVSMARFAPNWFWRQQVYHLQKT